MYVSKTNMHYTTIHKTYINLPKTDTYISIMKNRFGVGCEKDLLVDSDFSQFWSCLRSIEVCRSVVRRSKLYMNMDEFI